jgi:peptide/nickel transport system permease protein
MVEGAASAREPTPEGPVRESGVDHGARTVRVGWYRFVESSLLFLRIMRANPLTLVGFILVVAILGAALAVVAVPAVSQLTGHAVSILPYDPNTLNPQNRFAPSSWAHLMGTDDVGRDVLSRVLAALPLDLFIGFAIAGFSLALGAGLGLVAGFWDTPRTIGGAISTVILRGTDVFLSFPTLVLALAIAASLGRGTYPSMFAVMATWWPFYVRLTRGEVLAIKQQPYIIAARVGGVREGRILVSHVIRNLLEPLVVYFTLDVGTVIVTYSTISYVGIGVPEGIPEWGNMVNHYQPFFLTDPWLVGFVALAIFVTVLAFSLLGDGLRDVLDPRSRRALASAQMTSGLAPTLASRPAGKQE